jgi:nickel/cobalt transporter (NicO) family protein
LGLRHVSPLATPEELRQIGNVAVAQTRHQFGLWLSLVERSPRVRKVAGSNPVSPINPRQRAPVLAVSIRNRLNLQSRMNQTVLTTIAITGFGVAFFHAAIPTHWLPFVLTARVQGWNASKTIAVTALAGTGHVLVTAALGLAITLFGAVLSETIGAWFPRIAGGALLLFGAYYLVRQMRGKGHVHFHYPHEHLHEPGHGHDHAHGHEHANEHEHGHDDRSNHGCQAHPTSDRAAILSLLAFLTFSPCEGFVPFYVSGLRYGWGGFAVLTAVLSIATVAGMVLFTSLTLAGLSKIKLGLLEKYESVIMGVLLCIVGILIIVFET